MQLKYFPPLTEIVTFQMERSVCDSLPEVKEEDLEWDD